MELRGSNGLVSLRSSGHTPTTTANLQMDLKGSCSLAPLRSSGAAPRPKQPFVHKNAPNGFADIPALPIIVV